MLGKNKWDASWLLCIKEDLIVRKGAWSFIIWDFHNNIYLQLMGHDIYQGIANSMSGDAEDAYIGLGMYNILIIYGQGRRLSKIFFNTLL